MSSGNPDDDNPGGQDGAWVNPDHKRHTIADGALARAERELADNGHDAAARLVARIRRELAP
jgi:hypothetical protein